MKMQALGVTVLYPEVPALNRSENQGNILVLKRIGDFVYISRQAMRYYLWNTLKTSFGWKETKVNSESGVVQFSIEEITEELLSFGFMVAKKGKNDQDESGDKKGIQITRKAAVSMTDGEFLNRYLGEISFNANHDLVRRAGDADPAPYQKEEHRGILRWSVVIDVDRLLLFNIEDKWRDVLKQEQIAQINDTFVNKIVNDILTAIQEGIIYHVGGKNEPLTPIATFVYKVSIPSPLLHNVAYAKLEAGDKYTVNLDEVEEFASKNIYFGDYTQNLRVRLHPKVVNRKSNPPVYTNNRIQVKINSKDGVVEFE
ncbi:MAG: type I-B CRISPR-associated protein Cas7/Cst2/DevR [Candidatus Anstonellales archaeon]